MKTFIDLRRVESVFFNEEELAHSFGFHNSRNSADAEVYVLYKTHGDVFLNALRGEFTCAYKDEVLNTVFAVRDWIGEVPLHYYVTEETIYFANFVIDLVKNVPDFEYLKVIAVNRSEVVQCDLLTGICSKKLYYDFLEQPIHTSYKNINDVAKEVHDMLFESVKIRLSKTAHNTALLLSGGIDSMSVAYAVSVLNKKIPAYTLRIDSIESTDIQRARRITEAFGLDHVVVSISKEELLDCVRDAVSDSEIYHLYNVFCAIGMHILAKRLVNDGIEYVFTGEGGNEAFGDYHDWIVNDPDTKKRIILQETSKDFDTPAGREAYIWGNPISEARGLYNKQLGSGLGKHGGSRMYKPMQKMGITLLSPYLEKDIMKLLANIPEDVLKDLGGKQGFMKMAFTNEIQVGTVPESFFSVEKIRFQDASDGGGGGITELLLSHGFDQKRIIELFNEIFHANIAERSNLKRSVLTR